MKMKRYKLVKDLPTFKAGEIFYIDENGTLCAENEDGYFKAIAYMASTLKKFPNILEDWFEEIPEDSKRWRAEIEGAYYAIDSCGSVFRAIEDRSEGDFFRYSIGNYFKTEEDAKSTVAKLKAYQIIKEDLEGFAPDWKASSHRAVKDSLKLHKKEWYILFDSEEEGQI